MIDYLCKLFGYGFRWIYDFISSLGKEPAHFSFYAMSIIITTVILRFLMLPLFLKQSREMKKMAHVQPKINELQQKYKDDPNVLNQKMMTLMQEEKYNPMGGCLPMLLNLPIIMGFWRMMQNPETYIFTDGIYDTIANNFFWIKDLKVADPLVLPLISAVATFLSTKVSQKNQVQPTVGEKANQAKQMSDMMMVMFPFMIFWMGRNLASGLSLYWAVSNIFMVVQGVVMNLKLDKEREEALGEAKIEKLKKMKKYKE